MGRRAGLALAALAVVSFAVGCSSEDVTGEPEDIGTLVHIAGGERISLCDRAMAVLVRREPA